MTAQQLGRWTLLRSIVDRDAADEIRCVGSAQMRAHGSVIVYDEAVSFRLAGKLIRATRAYRFCASNGTIVATFSDGSPFFTLQLDANGSGTAIHNCGEDVYALRLALDGPDGWQTQWDVSGTKHLRIVSRYTR